MRFVAIFIGMWIAAWLGAGSGVAAVPADVLIQGGTVYSGAATAPTKDAVVIVGDEIVYVGPDGANHYDARETADARGKIVAPGFIDVHTHPETYVRSEGKLPSLQSKSTGDVGLDYMTGKQGGSAKCLESRMSGGFTVKGDCPGASGIPAKFDDHRITEVRL